MTESDARKKVCPEHGAPPSPAPDAREVCEVCGRPSVKSCTGIPGTTIDKVCFRVECGADTMCYPLGYERLAALVNLDPSLAQRILAALTKVNAERERNSLATELRAWMPK